MLDNINIPNIIFTNNSVSSTPSDIETVDDMRQNAPKSLYAQNRVVTASDLETYIKKNYSNIVSSIKAVNNLSYIDNVIKYYYTLGLDRPNRDSRVMFNEINFSTTGQANNVYVFMVPAIKSVDVNNNLYFLSQSQKATMLADIDTLKMLNMDIIPQDPVYTGVTIGLTPPGNTPTLTDSNTTQLVIQRDITNRISTQKIIENVNNIIVNYLATTNVSLGFLIDTTALQSQIFNIPGVVNILTRSTVNGVVYEVPYINLIVYNAVYPDLDIVSTSNSIQLTNFKYPFLRNGDVSSKIIVEVVNA